jgi:YbbR domain-containing protein
VNIDFYNIIQNLRSSEKIKSRRKISAFFICFIVAALFWLMNTLSQHYNAFISFPVKYENLPDNKVLTRRLPESVYIELNARGFHILAYQIKLLRDTIKIDAGNLPIRNRNDFYEARLATATKLNRITRQFNDEIRVNRILPDTIYFVFGTKVSKEIPVKLNHQLSFEKQHRLNGNVTFEPATVMVEGLESAVNKIEFIETESLVLKNLNQSVNKQINLFLHPSYAEKIFLSNKTVTVKIPVEKYTEASVEVPLEVINLPENHTMKLFPEKVNINYIVGFTDYDKINEQMFTARVDYNKRDNTSRLPIEISRHPETVQILRVQPPKAEYLIRKR